MTQASTQFVSSRFSSAIPGSGVLPVKTQSMQTLHTKAVFIHQLEQTPL